MRPIVGCPTKMVIPEKSDLRCCISKVAGPIVICGEIYRARFIIGMA